MTSNFDGQIRVSASRIKAIKQCTFKFFCNEIERLPEKPHPKTVAGSICHSIFECLKNPRHRDIYNTIIQNNTIAGTPVERLVKLWQQKHNIPQDIIDPIDAMTLVGLTKIDFFHSKATKVFPPEHEFKLELENGIVKGYIDDLAIYGDKAKIRDFKSQKNKFTAKELDEEIQAAVYQLYVWKAFKLPAEVEFVLLRHAPTKRHPNLHLQIVPAKNPAQLAGVEIYLNHMASVFKNFGLNDAYADFAAHHKDREWMCKYVCPYKEAFEYKSVRKDGKLVKNYFMDDEVNLGPGETLEIRKHAGCPAASGKNI